jgi:hypothetical protein
MLGLILAFALLCPTTLLANHPEYITIDVSKLPPGIANQVRTLSLESQLPPGLAKKAIDHPGRLVHMKRLMQKTN